MSVGNPKRDLRQDKLQHPNVTFMIRKKKIFLEESFYLSFGEPQSL